MKALKMRRTAYQRRREMAPRIIYGAAGEKWD